jgi:hypothetical protein
MKKFIVAFLLVCGTAFAADITIPLPEGVTEEQMKEWVAILKVRKIEQKIKTDPAIVAVLSAGQIEEDSYRKSLGLTPKYEKVAEPIEDVKPIEDIKEG